MTMIESLGVAFDVLAGVALIALAIAVVGARRKAGKLHDRLERLRARVGWLEGQSLQLRKRAAEAEVRAVLAKAGRMPAIEVRAMSQYGEDALVWALLGDRVEAGGFFIEAGAFDGKQLSVTWLLESAGWRGVLVEPIPARAEACAQHRPGSHVVNSALGEPGGPSELEFSVVQGPDDGLGMLSAVSSVQGRDAELAEQEGATTRQIRVPVTTLDAALAEAADRLGPIDRVDAMVLDVEGFEATALRGFDLARWKPRVLVIEDNTMGREREASSIIESAGYIQTGWIGVNRVYIAGDEAELRERALAWTTPLGWPRLTVVGM